MKTSTVNPAATAGYILIAAAAFLSFSCSTKFTLENLDSTLAMYKIAKLPTQEEYPDANAVIIIDQTDIQILTGRKEIYTVETRHMMKKLLRNIGEESTVNIFVGEDEELTDITARTIRPDGSIVELQPADYYTITGMAHSSILFANVKTVRFTFPAADKECIIEYRYEKRKENPFIKDVWHIQNDLPTIHNQYSLTMPLFMEFLLPYKYKVYPKSIVMDPEVVYDNNHFRSYFSNPVTHIWARGNIPAFKPEERMPQPESFRTQIRFALASWDGWNGIAEWYYKNFFESQLVVSDSVKRLAHRLTDSVPTQPGKIKSVYRYVQKLRYIAVQLNESGLRPSTPQEIIRNNYGDCKDKSILVIALLKAIGITAYPVLVLTGPSGKFDPDFPSWNFNHMIAKAVGERNEVYWMDPTSEFSRFNSLPWEVQNIPVMTLNSDTSGIIETTPGSTAEENATKINLYVEVSKDGSAAFNAKINCTGEEARFYRTMLTEKSYTEEKEFFQKMIINDAAHAVIDTAFTEHYDNLDTALTINVQFTVPQVLQRQSDLTLYSTNVFKVVGDLQWIAKEKRTFPVWYPYGSSIAKGTVIWFKDSSLSIRSLPKAEEMNNRFISYNISFREANKNAVAVKESMTIKETEIPAVYYKPTKEYYERIKIAGEMAIVFETGRR